MSSIAGKVDFEVRSPEKPARGKKLTIVAWDPGDEEVGDKPHGGRVKR